MNRLCLPTTPAVELTYSCRINKFQSQMVGYSPEYYSILSMRLEYPLSKKLVRGQEGLVESE